MPAMLPLVIAGVTAFNLMFAFFLCLVASPRKAVSLGELAHSQRCWPGLPRQLVRA